MPSDPENLDIAIIGGGPAGLAAAEVLNASGRSCVVFEAMPTMGRKFLMAGKSGLNLTKNEETDRFLSRFGTSAEMLAPMISPFGPKEVVDWVHTFDEKTFTGSSGRVFPVSMKASPLLRKWLRSLDHVDLRTRWRWTGFDDGLLVFDTPDGRKRIKADKTLLALGGASWPRLGSDAAWVPWLEALNVPMTPFQPSNVGAECQWPDDIAQTFAGAPLKNIRLTCGSHAARGDVIVTHYGLEAGPIYALSPALRTELASHDKADIMLDLLPDRHARWINERLSRPRGKSSISNHWRKALNISGIKTRLLREHVDRDAGPEQIAEKIKSIPLHVTGLRPIAEAISSAGGVAWDGLNPDLSLKAQSDIFCAGEMLDWDAPTGGYLITACLATGRHAAKGILAAG